MKVTINRSRWIRGKTASALVAGNNMVSKDPSIKHGDMCCLGFICEAYGVPTNYMTDIGMPWALLAKALPDEAKWLGGNDADDQVVLMAGINDSLEIGDSFREATLSNLATVQGIELEFV